MSFEKALAAQHELQVNTFKKDPKKLTGDEQMDWIRWNVLALEDELHEMLAETGWKPWATSKHVNRDAYVSELVDSFHFFMNLMLIVDCTPEELLTKYFHKRKVNIKRQADGYDGVEGKCRMCHRALDDDAVDCTEFICSFDD
jgi:dimeric dUTPase (all-alpha-NTP-PPase superfamily)